jgi:uncharacterized membrane protein required for colicin V production
MSTIDIAAIGAVALFALLGLFSGFVAQIFRIFALITATFLAVNAPDLVPQLFPAKTEGREIFLHVFSIITIWVVSYTVLAVIFSFIVRRFHRAAPVLSVIDRIIGCALGAVKGFIFIYVSLCILVLMNDKLTEQGFIPRNETESSFTWKAVSEHNILKGRISGLP